MPGSGGPPGEVVRRNRVRYARRSRPSVVRATRRSLPCVTRSRGTSLPVARWARPSACSSKDSGSSIWSGDGPTRRGPVDGRPRRWSTSTRSGSRSWACSRSSWSTPDRSGSTTRSPRSGRSSRPEERTGRRSATRSAIAPGCRRSASRSPTRTSGTGTGWLVRSLRPSRGSNRVRATCTTPTPTVISSARSSVEWEVHLPVSG